MDEVDGEIGFWRFVWLCIREAWRTSWEKADTGATAVGVILGVVVHYVPKWESAVNNLLWQIPIACLASITVTRLLLSPFLVYRTRDNEAKEAENQVRELTTRVIKVNGVPSPQEDHYLPTTTTGLLYRVDVLNASEVRSVRNVEVKLTGIEPDIPELRLPVPLQHMHDRTTPRQTSFHLNPQDHKLIDLVYARSDYKGIFVAHTVAGVQSQIPSGNYTLTVRATGDDTRAEVARFHVWDTGGILHCEML